MITSTFCSAATSVSAAIGTAALARELAQRVAPRVPRGRPEAPPQDDAERDGRRSRSEPGAQVGARDAEAEGDEQRAGGEAPQRLEHDRQADGPVRAGRLQQPALQAQHEPQPGRGDHGGGRPLLVDVEQGGERLARQHRERR